MIGATIIYIERGDGAAVAHRALQTGGPRLATIDNRRQRCAPIRVVGEAGAGERLVPVADLAPAAPLSEAEEREYQRLDRQLAGTIGDARLLKRFNGLRLRSIMFGTQSPQGAEDRRRGGSASEISPRRRSSVGEAA